MENIKRKVLIFGYGNFGIATGGELDSPTNELIIYKLDSPVLPLGKKLKDIGKTTDELNTVARWRFEDKKSVQVVIDALKKIKKAIEKEE